MRRRDDSNRFENPIMLKSVVRVVNVIQATNIQLVGAIHRADVDFSVHNQLHLGLKTKFFFVSMPWSCDFSLVMMINCLGR